MNNVENNQNEQVVEAETVGSLADSTPAQRGQTDSVTHVDESPFVADQNGTDVAAGEEEPQQAIVDTHEEKLDISVDEVMKMDEELRQSEEEEAHMALARNVANLILNRTDFLNQVVRYTTRTIIEASAQFQQAERRAQPQYVITRENNNTHVFYIDITDFNPEQPMAAKFSFYALGADEHNEPLDRLQMEHWLAVQQLPQVTVASLVAQMGQLSAIPGDRFYGHIYAPNAAPAPNILDEITNSTVTTDELVNESLAEVVEEQSPAPTDAPTDNVSEATPVADEKDPV